MSGEAAKSSPSADLSGPPGPLTMVEVLAVVGELWAVETGLFSWLGACSRFGPSEVEGAGGTGQDHLVVWASAASLRAAWRARQLHELLPVSRGLAADPPEPAGFGPAVPPAVALRVALENYGALAAAYEARLGRLMPAADGHLERVLRRVAADVEGEVRAAEAVSVGPGRGA